MGNVNFTIEATNRARNAYESIKVEPLRGTSFAVFRDAAIRMRKAILARHEQLEEQKQKNREMFNTQVAGQMNNELDEKFSADVAGVRQNLIDKFNEIADAKRGAVERFTMIPPSEDSIRLISAYQLRDSEDISDLEWKMLISKGDNYQTSRMIQGLAKKYDKTYILPFSPDSALKEIDDFADIALSAVNRDLDKPDNLLSDSFSHRFFRMNGEDGNPYDPYIGEMIAKLDGEAGTTVEDKNSTIYARLQTAMKTAYDCSNMPLYDSIKAFISQNMKQLATAEEMKDSLISQAETLIRRADR